MTHQPLQVPRWQPTVLAALGAALLGSLTILDTHHDGPPQALLRGLILLLSLPCLGGAALLDLERRHWPRGQQVLTLAALCVLGLSLTLLAAGLHWPSGLAHAAQYLCAGALVAAITAGTACREVQLTAARGVRQLIGPLDGDAGARQRLRALRGNKPSRGVLAGHGLRRLKQIRTVQDHRYRTTFYFNSIFYAATQNVMILHWSLN